jgi:hypothetical protein
MSRKSRTNQVNSHGKLQYLTELASHLDRVGQLSCRLADAV